MSADLEREEKTFLVPWQTLAQAFTQVQALGQFVNATEKSLMCSLICVQHLPVQNAENQTNWVTLRAHHVTNPSLCSHNVLNSALVIPFYEPFWQSGRELNQKKIPALGEQIQAEGVHLLRVSASAAKQMTAEVQERWRMTSELFAGSWVAIPLLNRSQTFLGQW